ncbi:MAG: Tyrosyl-tRNA synthetase [uncultured Solirubrobacteraceae bacterium]|uniref:Tyrosine--tRNA ligase n=1 Tax=uncultured Solirubrobacteraceae bacterium TaxID=1162706 RepID=A0A6J4TA15_9ACTN|nr:MAG: Tyrosyl-tRNA synthetase [uncultured Solirubrobacteraceae bacterium]
MQFGGSDQWGNITAGLELLRRTGHDGAVGMTVPLLLRSDGTKFGNTESGAVWLERAMTSPYAFYQFFFNTQDDQVPVLLRRLSLLERDVIEELEERHAVAPHERAAQRALAEHLTTLVHGEEGLTEALAVTEWMFGDPSAYSGNLDEALRGIDVPSLTAVDLTTWGALARTAGLAGSNAEARRLIEGGGFYAGDRKIGPDDAGPTVDDFKDGFLLLRKGRKTRQPVRLVES